MFLSLRRIFLLGITVGAFGAIFSSWLPVYAQATQHYRDAIIQFPYYKKTERWIYTCPNGNELCNENQRKRTEEKTGKSALSGFLEKLVTNLIPGSGLFISPNFKSSEKETTLYKPWYVKSYGLTSCKKEHTYTTFWGSLSILRGKFGTSEGKIKSSCAGEKGTEEQIILTDSSPDIDERTYRGTFTTSLSAKGTTIEHAVKEDSRALLKLTIPEAITVPPATMKEVCRMFLKELPKTCANTALSTLVPGGRFISASGIPELITDEIQHLLFKDNPKWKVPLSVKVYSLVTTPSGVEENLLPCNRVKVAGKALGANCSTTVSISKKQLMRDVTPSADAPYYRYEIAVSGPAVKLASADNRSLLGTMSQSLNIGGGDDEELLPLDQDGFWKVEGADNEDLPLEETSFTSRIQTLRAQVESLRATRNQLKLQLDSIRKRNFAPSPAEKLNAAPQRLQLGDISETLSQELGALLKIR